MAVTIALEVGTLRWFVFGRSWRIVAPVLSTCRH
jgi:hypothetical protein